MKKINKSDALKFMAISVSSLIFDTILLFILVHFFNVFYLYASTISFLVAGLCGYYFIRNYIFMAKGIRVSRLVKYFLFEVLSLVFILIFLKIFVETFSINYIISRIVAGIIVGGGLYLLNHTFTFKK